MRRSRARQGAAARAAIPTLLVAAMLGGAFVSAGALFAAPAPTFPGETWAFRTPDELDLSPMALAAFQAYVGGRGAVVRYGYMGYTWGDQAVRGDVASASKPVIVHFMLSAWERKYISSLEAPLVRWEPRLQSLNPELGYKDRRIDWRHVANMASGYGVREAPGAAFDYSDYNVALFWDTLFLKVYRASYETVDSKVLLPKLFTKIGAQDAPTFLAFGLGSRPGRLAISVRDFARFGLLYVNQGSWRWRRLLQPESVQLATQNPPFTAALPRTSGVAAEMIPGQRTLGGGRDQAPHRGSYNYAWWVNGRLPDGTVRWPTAPFDAFMASGHWGRRVLFVVPSLQLVVSWNNGTPDSLAKEREAIRLLMAAVE